MDSAQRSQSEIHHVIKVEPVSLSLSSSISPSVSIKSLIAVLSLPLTQHPNSAAPVHNSNSATEHNVGSYSPEKFSYFESAATQSPRIDSTQHQLKAVSSHHVPFSIGHLLSRSYQLGDCWQLNFDGKITSDNFCAADSDFTTRNLYRLLISSLSKHCMEVIPNRLYCWVSSHGASENRTASFPFYISSNLSFSPLPVSLHQSSSDEVVITYLAFPQVPSLSVSSSQLPPESAGSSAAEYTTPSLGQNITADRCDDTPLSNLIDSFFKSSQIDNSKVSLSHSLLQALVFYCDTNSFSRHPFFDQPQVLSNHSTDNSPVRKVGPFAAVTQSQLLTRLFQPKSTESSEFFQQTTLQPPSSTSIQADSDNSSKNRNNRFTALDSSFVTVRRVQDTFVLSALKSTPILSSAEKCGLNALPDAVSSVIDVVTQIYQRSCGLELYRLLQVHGPTSARPEVFSRTISSNICLESVDYIDISRIQRRIRSHQSSASDLKDNILKCLSQEFRPFPQHHEDTYYLSTDRNNVEPCFLLLNMMAATPNSKFIGGFPVDLSHSSSDEDASAQVTDSRSSVSIDDDNKDGDNEDASDVSSNEQEFEQKERLDAAHNIMSRHGSSPKTRLSDGVSDTYSLLRLTSSRNHAANEPTFSECSRCDASSVTCIDPYHLHQPDQLEQKVGSEAHTDSRSATYSPNEDITISRRYFPFNKSIITNLNSINRYLCVYLIVILVYCNL